MSRDFAPHNIMYTTRVGFSYEGTITHLCRWNATTGWTPICHTPDIQSHTHAYEGHIIRCVACLALEHVRDEEYFPSYWEHRALGT